MFIPYHHLITSVGLFYASKLNDSANVTYRISTNLKNKHWWFDSLSEQLLVFLWCFHQICLLQVSWDMLLLTFCQPAEKHLNQSYMHVLLTYSSSYTFCNFLSISVPVSPNFWQNLMQILLPIFSTMVTDGTFVVWWDDHILHTLLPNNRSEWEYYYNLVCMSHKIQGQPLPSGFTQLLAEQQSPNNFWSDLI